MQNSGSPLQCYVFFLSEVSTYSIPLQLHEAANLASVIQGTYGET